MNTPLLASNEPHEVPCLSGGVDDPDANSQLTRMLREASSPPLISPLIRNSNRGFIPPTHGRRSRALISFLSILVGSLTIVQIGLLWGSFLSPSWLQLHLLVTHVLLTEPVDTVLQDLDLGSMVATFVSTRQTSAVALLAITTVMIPCCAMIAQPMIVWERHAAVVLGTPYETKSMIYVFLRFGFLVVFMVLILDFAFSFIDIAFVGTETKVQTRMGPGLVSYTIGMTMALVSAKLLIVATVSSSSIEEPIDATEEGYMRVLEDEEDDQEEESVGGSERALVAQPRTDGICFCSYKLLLFESATLSIILWIAAFALPLFKVSYEGAISDLLSHTMLQVYLADLVQPPMGAAHAILQATVITQIFVFPLLALFFATGTCAFGFQKRWLAGVYPAVNGMSICAAIFIVIPALTYFGLEMLNDQASGFCNEFRDLTGESCLSLVGTVEAGTWFLVGHVIALETFILLSLGYSPKD